MAATNTVQPLLASPTTNTITRAAFVGLAAGAAGTGVTVGAGAAARVGAWPAAGRAGTWLWAAPGGKPRGRRALAFGAGNGLNRLHIHTARLRAPPRAKHRLFRFQVPRKRTTPAYMVAPTYEYTRANLALCVHAAELVSDEGFPRTIAARCMGMKPSTLTKQQQHALAGGLQTASPPSSLALEVARLLQVRQQLEYALFFPSQASHDELIRLIGLARGTMGIAVFVLSSRALVAAILAANELGVTVRVVCDAQELSTHHCLAHLLVSAGIQVRAVGNQHGSLHHKYTIIDGTALLSGSINWSLSGMERNHENLIIRKGGPLLAEFSMNFATLWSIWSRPWQPTAMLTPARRFGS